MSPNDSSPNDSPPIEPRCHAETLPPSTGFCALVRLVETARLAALRALTQVATGTPWRVAGREWRRQAQNTLTECRTAAITARQQAARIGLPSADVEQCLRETADCLAVLLRVPEGAEPADWLDDWTLRTRNVVERLEEWDAWANPEITTRGASESNPDSLPLCPQWLDNPGNFPSIPLPPPSVRARQGSDLGDRAYDAWLCACRIHKIIDVWLFWFTKLETTGEADPGAAVRLSETASTCLRALWDCGAKIPTLQREGPQWVEVALPPIPIGADGEWQKDRQIIDAGRTRLRGLNQFQGELTTFMTLLANSLSTGFDTPPKGQVAPPDGTDNGPDQAGAGSSKSKRGGGRNQEYDEKKDKKLCEDWQAAKRQGASREEFCNHHRINLQNLIDAQHREKYRRTRDAE
jgi:hypothetical protein